MDTEKNIETNIDANVDIIEKHSKKKKWLFSIISVIIFIAAGTGFYVFKQKQEEKKMAELKEYDFLISATAMEMLTTASDAEEVLNKVSTVWHDAIYIDYYRINGERVYDFNQALEITYEEFNRNGKIQALEDSITEVEKSLKSLKNYPEGFKETYDLTIEMYKPAKKFVDLAISPEGNLRTFNQKINNLRSEIISASDELELKRYSYEEAKEN